MANAYDGLITPAMRENLGEWLENPSWAEYWNGAPTERCRAFITLEFFYSEYEEEETAEAMDRIEAEMSAEELKYLLKYCGRNPRMKVLLDRIAALGG